MMDENIISFTKLGTVKSKAFPECSYESFFKRMRELLNKDISKYQIVYKKKKNLYIIKYNGKEYKVTYGDELLTDNCNREDIIRNIDSLVDLSSDLKELYDIEVEKEQEGKDTLELVLENASKGVFISNEHRQRYLDYLKEQEKNNPFIKSLLAKFKKSIVYDSDDIELVEIRAGSEAAITFASSLIFVLFIPSMNIALVITLIILIMGIPTADIIYHLVRIILGNPNGKFAGPLSFLWGLIKLPYNIVKTVLEKRKINRTIKSLESILSKSKSKKVVEPKVSEKEEQAVKEKYLDNGNVEKVDNEVTKYVNEMSNIFDMVHKKVLSISDNKKKSDYSKQLLTIILDYTEKSKLFYKNGVDIRYHNSIIDRVSLLEHDIDIVLAEEKEKRSREEETDRMLNAVDEVINYRASGK